MQHKGSHTALGYNPAGGGKTVTLGEGVTAHMFRPTSLEDTRLWSHLNSVAQAGGAGSVESVVAGNLIQICGEAADRMRMFPSLHPQYTLHDETHLLRVTELMGLVIPDQMLQRELNVVEIALLILSAYFHDEPPRVLWRPGYWTAANCSWSCSA